jgi:hypothetical protein
METLVLIYWVRVCESPYAVQKPFILLYAVRYLISVVLRISLLVYGSKDDRGRPLALGVGEVFPSSIARPYILAKFLLQ